MPDISYSRLLMRSGIVSFSIPPCLVFGAVTCLMCSIDILIGFGFGISEGTLDRFTDADVPTSLFQFGHADDTFKKNGKLAGSDPG